MPPLFDRRAELAVKLVLLWLGVGAASLLILLVWGERTVQPVGEVVAQPIPFSHKHHVGDDGIDCRYCHTTVERAAFAGMPSTRTCLTCHSQLFKDQPMLAPLHDSAATGKPIAWRRVYVLPGYVYFNHAVHVTGGVACMECHGRIDQMPITWRAAPLQMQWCLGCHRNPAPHLHPPDQVFAMPALQRAGVGSPARLPDTRRLTDCSTCHR